MDIAISDAELTVYKLLSTLSDKWYFWFSRSWIDESNQFISIGEADFLVLHPEFGFILLEVKGGGISYVNGLWTTTNSKNETFTIKDPFDQARKSMFFFRNYYIRLAKKEQNRGVLLSKQNKFPGRYFYAVIFPDCYFKDSMFQGLPSAKVGMIFDASDIKLHDNWILSKQRQSKSPLERFLLNLFDKFNIKSKIRFPEKVTAFFTRIITPKIETSYSLSRLITKYQEELEKENKRQDEMLETFSNKKQLIFKGKAGTGKTFIAMKKSLRLYDEGKYVLFLCFNRELMFFVREYINNKIQSMSVTPGNIMVTNIHRFLLNFSKEHLKRPDYEKFMRELEADNRKYILDSISEISSWGNLNPKYRFDGIIVDEAQDIGEEFANLFKFFLKNEQESTFWIFFDDAQQIFTSNFAIINFGLNKNIDCFELVKNLRNVDNIIEWIEYNTKILYKYYSGVAGKEIELIRIDTFSKALNEVMIRVFELIYDKNLEFNQIIILSDKKLSYLKNLIKLQSNHIEGTVYYFKRYSLKDLYPGKIIYLVEPHQLKELPNIKTQLRTGSILLHQGIGTFKGLERDIVFLLITNLEEYKRHHTKNEYERLLMRTYVGASRARFMLYVIEYTEIC